MEPLLHLGRRAVTARRSSGLVDDGPMGRLERTEVSQAEQGGAFERIRFFPRMACGVRVDCTGRCTRGETRVRVSDSFPSFLR